jgi:hypothetical protein
MLYTRTRTQKKKKNKIINNLIMKNNYNFLK